MLRPICSTQLFHLFYPVRRNWVEQFASLTVTTHPSPKVAAAQEITEEEDVALSSRWALQKARGGTVTFSPKVRRYISLKFDAGERTGRKANPQHVAQDMRTARDESGNRIFEREEWLTKTQIQRFFSRLTSNRRKLVCEEESQDEELNNADQLYQEIVQDVNQEVCTDHPIMYDIYDICDYSRQDILNKFNVKMLKAICKRFELSFTSKSLKVDLIDKIKAMVAECSCS